MKLLRNSLFIVTFLGAATIISLFVTLFTENFTYFGLTIFLFLCYALIHMVIDLKGRNVSLEQISQYNNQQASLHTNPVAKLTYRIALPAAIVGVLIVIPLLVLLLRISLN